MQKCNLCGKEVKGGLAFHQNSKACKEAAMNSENLQSEKNNDMVNTEVEAEQAEGINTPDADSDSLFLSAEKSTAPNNSSQERKNSGLNITQHSSNERESEEVEVRVKKKGNRSFQPSSLLDYQLKDPSYGKRFARGDKLQKFLNETIDGQRIWSKVNYKELDSFSKETTIDGQPLTSTVKKRELTLIKIKKSDLAVRNEYYADQSKTDSELEQEAKAKLKMELDGGTEDVSAGGVSVTTTNFRG